MTAVARTFHAAVTMMPSSMNPNAATTAATFICRANMTASRAQMMIPMTKIPKLLRSRVLDMAMKFSLSSKLTKNTIVIWPGKLIRMQTTMLTTGGTNEEAKARSNLTHG